MKRTAAEAAQTRQNICEAAIGVFSRYGWAQATFQNIAAAAGVTRGAVYHHFSDKTQLLIEATTLAWAQHTDQAVAQLTSHDLAPADQLTSFLDTYLTRLATSQSFRDLAVVSTLVAPQAVAGSTKQTEQQATAAKADALGVWGELLHEVMVRGETQQLGLTPQLAVEIVLTFLNGLTVTAAINPTGLPAVADTHRAAAAVTRAVLPPAMVTRDALPAASSSAETVIPR
jgi:TetR/AcrR family transcriptional regulator, acrAB operon repressor